MNTLTIVFGAGMTAFVFINFFVKSWAITLAIICLGIGCLVAMPDPKNPYLFSAVAVVAVGQLVAFIVVKYRNP